MTSLKCRSTASAKTTLVVMTTAVDADVDAIRATVAPVDRAVVVADVVREKARVVVDVAVAATNVDLVAFRMAVMIHVR